MLCRRDGRRSHLSAPKSHKTEPVMTILSLRRPRGAPMPFAAQRREQRRQPDQPLLPPHDRPLDRALTPAPRAA